MCADLLLRGNVFYAMTKVIIDIPENPDRFSKATEQRLDAAARRLFELYLEYPLSAGPWEDIRETGESV